jgi:polyisoprenoid-binding protein YceI
MAIAGGLAPAAAAGTPADGTGMPVMRSSAIDFTVFVKALFTMKQQGQFKDFEGQVNYDPADPSGMRLNLTIFTASVDTRDKGHDEMLRSPDFFDVGRYPTMRFLSTSVTVGAGGDLEVDGDLTIRGVTKRLAVPVTVRRGAQDDPSSPTRFETTFEIDRTDFGLNGSPKYGGFNVSVARKVRIHLAIVAAPRH